MCGRLGGRREDIRLLQYLKANFGKTLYE